MKKILIFMDTFCMSLVEVKEKKSKGWILMSYLMISCITGIMKW